MKLLVTVLLTIARYSDSLSLWGFYRPTKKTETYHPSIEY